MDKMTRLSKLLKILLIIVLIIAMVCGAVCFINRNYKKYDFVITYLNNKYDGEYKIKKCDLKHYDYGFMAGMYMYRFLIIDENGEKYVVTYDSYWPLSEEHLGELKFSKE
ncbi:MAG: hypothetical protein IJ716_11485 [Lachnospiraceae bacterium]|nr:hypothetical protein [Lachnospiraceae bacterium]